MKKVLLTILLGTFSYAIGQTWVELQQISDPFGHIDSRFGSIVSMSGDYVAVGAPIDWTNSAGESPIEEAGAVFVYKRNTSTNSWSFMQKIVAPDRDIFDYFGVALAMHGTTIVVGAPYEDQDEFDVTLNGSGSVYVFDLIGSTWTLSQKLKASDREVADYFGTTVAFDGTTIVVGTPFQDTDLNGQTYLNNAGAAYVFENEGSWVQKAKLSATDRRVNDKFGDRVAVLGDIIVIGAEASSLDEFGANPLPYAGSAYYFKRNVSDQWEFKQKLVASHRLNTSWFGSNISLTETHLAISAWGDDTDENNAETKTDAGAVYLFKLETTGLFSQIQKIVSPNRIDNGHFGYGLTIDGDNLLVSARGEGTVSYSGVMHTYKFNGIDGFNHKSSHESSNAAAYTNFGSALSSSGNYAIAADILQHVYIYELQCINSQGVDQITSCDPITWIDGNEYTTSTSTPTYTFVGGAANGCDSIVNLNYTLIPPINTNVTIDIAGMLTAEQTVGNYQWIDCNNGNQPVAGATNRTFTPTQNGSYAVILSNSGCEETSTCFLIENVSLNHTNPLSKVLVYPNPTKGELNIHLPLNATIEITNVQGQHIQSFEGQEGLNSIELHQKAGIYFLTVHHENYTNVYRFVKE